jgi:hypothetical protein
MVRNFLQPDVKIAGKFTYASFEWWAFEMF